MSPKSIILLAMALGCGLVAAVGINQIMARPTDAPETVQVVVAKREIQKGEPFRPDDIRLQDWPKDTVPEGAIDSIEKLVDKRSRGMVYTGEPIIDKKLIGKGDMQSLSPEVPAGMKAISVKVDNESGLAGMILPGDNVDVLLHAEANPSKQIFETKTGTIETNMKVMAVDDQMDRPDGKESSITGKTVTLLATPKQASRITHACAIGTVRLVLCSGKDDPDADVGNSDVNTPELFGNTASSEPATPGNKIVALPPVHEGPTIGAQFEGGVNSLRDLIKDIKNARDGQFTEEKEKPFVVTLIEGPDAREIEFDPSASKAGNGTGLAAKKASAAGADVDVKTESGEEAEKPAAEGDPSTDKMLKSLFNPNAQRQSMKSGGPILVK